MDQRCSTVRDALWPANQIDNQTKRLMQEHFLRHPNSQIALRSELVRRIGCMEVRALLPRLNRHPFGCATNAEQRFSSSLSRGPGAHEESIPGSSHSIVMRSAAL